MTGDMGPLAERSAGALAVPVPSREPHATHVSDVQSACDQVSRALRFVSSPVMK